MPIRDDDSYKSAVVHTMSSMQSEHFSLAVLTTNPAKIHKLRVHYERNIFYSFDINLTALN